MERRSHRTGFLLCLLLLCLALAASAEGVTGSSKGPYKICLAADAVDFYPFQRLDGKMERMALYSLTLRSYFSNNPASPSILQKFAISADGRKLTATIAPDALWQDGTRITAREAALGIAKGLTFRGLGKRVRVAGTELINEPGWQNREYLGVRIIDEDSFELTFESNVVHGLDHLIRRSLSPGGTFDRFWPARFSKIDQDGYRPGEFDAISRYPIYKDNRGQYKILVNGYEFLLQTGPCEGDIYLILMRPILIGSALTWWL